MVGITSSRWGVVERWSPTLFLIGGVLFLGHAALAGIRGFTGMTMPPDVFAPAGHCLALVGLLGLRPVVESRMPRLAWAAGLLTVLALGSWVSMTLTQFLALAGLAASIGATLPGYFVLTVLASTILSYGLFGVGALRVDTRSPRVGLLVLAPGGLTTAVAIVPAFTGGTALAGLVIGGGLAVSTMALGYTLRTWDGRDAHTTGVEAGVLG